MSIRPLNLFVTHPGTSARQRVTCEYKCAQACFHPISNTSQGEYFGDIVQAGLSRRSMLRASAIALLSLGTGAALAACSTDSGTPTTSPTGPASDTPVPGLNFTAVAPNTQDAVVIPEGYQQAVVIRWGDPVLPGAPAFDVRAQSAAAQRQQFGFNNDFAALLPVDGSPDTHLLVTNHEYTTEQFMFYGWDPQNPTRDQFEIAIAAHGLSVVEVRGETGSGKLTPVLGPRNRRITADTPFTLTGPAAGSDLVKTSADPAGATVLGTFANCSGGVTPWGTVLSGEENFHSYFGVTEAPPAKPAGADVLKRYGLRPEPSVRKWERFDPRFDLGKEPNEVNRFGYIVELNPYDPQSVPMKHSSMGRLKHESANVYVTGDGTVIAYSGDDERFEYIYKFVSSRKMLPGRDRASTRENMRILSEGTLYVATLTGEAAGAEIDGSGKLPAHGRFGGTGAWIPLLRTNADGTGESLVPGMSAQEVAVFTRLAADKAGATKMDRPEDIEPNPKTGKVYVALTNNSQRGTGGKAAVDEANPRIENKNGQVLEIEDDHTGTTFGWNLLLVCGDPQAADTYYGGFDKTRVSPISCPDNVAFDDHGNLWISTDGNALDSNDGLFGVVLDGPRRGETKQFLTVPVGAETCGPVITDKRVLVCVQHPGESDEGSLEQPASHWPDGGDSVARPAVVAVWKPDGRIGL